MAGYAPTLASSDDMPTLHNVADPNAPFTLRPAHPPQLLERSAILDLAAVPVCAPDQLSLFETRSRINGNQHTLRLTLENQGDACRLAGFPVVTLLDAAGNVMSGVSIQKVSENTLAATLGSPEAAGQASQGDMGAPPPQVLLAAHNDATFELGWTGGTACRPVARIAVSTPGSAAALFVPRRLELCEDRILITAVAPGGAE